MKIVQEILTLITKSVYAVDYTIDKSSLGFTPPGMSEVITFVIRAFFVIGGLMALLYLLLGALAWITSGGDKDRVTKAREKIQAAVIGLILIFVVLGLVVLLENVLSIGLGISKPIQFPQLIHQSNGGSFQYPH